VTREQARAVGIDVTGLGYHYPDGSPALRSIDLRLDAGERVALIGPNGAGKSTLLLHMAGLLPERRRYLHQHEPGGHAHRHGLVGRIAIDGVEVRPATIRRIRDLVGLVFQDPDDQLIGLTVAEDVSYGPRARAWPPDEVERAVKAALEAVGLPDHGHRSPHHLSTGEKRRVCLAGVLVSKPGLLLLDEPSSGLDPRGRRSLARLLAGLDATQVIATHDLRLVEQVCSRAVVLDAGTVVADGPTAAILGDAPLLERHGLS
jgi:energy-coupling factor transporter ATP-binding protein EcfA2